MSTLYPLQTNERLRNCSTMKRPEPHQDFEKTIQRVIIRLLNSRNIPY